MENNDDPRLKELIEAAHADPHLKHQLLRDPKAVAKKWNVELGSREVDRLSKVGAFVELANEARRGRVFRCNPTVCYPATTWLKFELLDLIREYITVIKPPKEWVFYPPDLELRLDERLNLRR